MADISLPNQPMSDYRSLLNDNRSFIHITPPPIWSETGTTRTNSHHNTRSGLENEISTSDTASSRQESSSSQTSPINTHREETYQADNSSSPYSSPLVRTFQSSSQGTHTEETFQVDNSTSQSSSPLVRTIQSSSQGLEQPTELQDSPWEEERPPEQQPSFEVPKATTHNHHQSNMDSTLALPSQEGMPTDSSITITQQAGHQDSDLNSNFSFPMQPASEQTRRLDELYLATHAPTPRIRTRHPRTTAHDLPAFSFGSSPNNSLGSGQLSPELPSRTTSSNTGDSVGLSSHETSRPEVLNTGNKRNLGPPSGQSFHKHRRSGAALSISADGPALPSRRPFGSAPSTPVELPQFNMEDQMAQLHTNPSTWNPMSDVPPSPRRGSATSTTRRRPIPSTAPFQPRPLSTIASDSGSNSSIDKEIAPKVCCGASSPLPAETFNASIDSTLNDNFTRADPNNAESIFSTPTPQRTADLDIIPILNLDPSSDDLPSPSTPRKLSTPRAPRSIPTDPFQVSASSIAQPFSFADEQETPGGRSRRHPRHRRAESSGEIPRPRTSPGRAQSEQTNDFHAPLPDFPSSPVGASRKESPRRLETSSASRPPSRAHETDFQFPASINFDDESSTATLEAAPIVPFKSASPQYSPFTSNENLTSEPTSAQSTSPLPSPSTEDYPHVIDLDAAGGSLSDCGMDSLSSSANAAMQRRLRMHSSGGRGGYSGTAMQIHRRAESAPEMPPPSFTGVSRMGSNAEMADVFEEEEEEQGPVELASSASTKKEGRAEKEGGDVMVGSDTSRTADGMHLENTPESVEGAVDEPAQPSTNQDVQVVDEEGWNTSIARSSDSTVIPPELADTPIKRPASTPLEVAVRAPGSFYAPSDFHSSAPSSGFPSPDPANVSFDHPRLPTATSSITDRGTFNSATSGENFWGVRGSVDRTPELTEDDDSMLTGAIPRHSSGAVTNSSFDRSAMTPGIPPVSPIRPSRLATTRKRGSLASLSKLMTTPGSKLRNEEKAPDDTSEHVEGKKKNRLSRLMGIFKKS